MRIGPICFSMTRVLNWDIERSMPCHSCSRPLYMIRLISSTERR